MITREQAEDAYHRERPDGEDYQSKIVSAEQVDWVELEHPDERNWRHWMQETVDWQEVCWQIGFQYRWKLPDGSWDRWFPGSCYVVEPKPGPYVVK